MRSTERMLAMPRNVGQWTGLFVTSAIVFGRDLDVIYAFPLGIMAGVLAAVLAALDEQWRNGAVLARVRRRQVERPASMP